MAFFRLVLKANRLEQARIVYHEEKLHAIEMSKGIKPHYTLSQKIRMKKILFKMKMTELIRKSTCWHEDSWFYRTITLLRTEGTIENFLIKSFIGFLSGILLTYMFFLFIVLHLHFTLFTATLLSSFFGIILTIGLAFSYRVRCVVFLLLPQFFSKRGRQALIAYAFIVTLTGPTNNTLNNIQVLSKSLTCGQEELMKAVTSTIDLIKRPFYALRDTITKLLKSMKQIVKKVEKTLLAIKRIVLNILRVMKSAFEWLGSIVSICNKKIGTPFERCSKVFEGAVSDCHAKLGPFFGGLCNLTYIVSVMCYIVKPLDFICILISFTSDIIVDTVGKRLKKFSSHLKTLFYVKVKFKHSFTFETNKSRSYKSVADEIVGQLKNRAEKFHTIFDWMSLITSFFIFCMLLRVLRYYYKWLSSDRYDNRYLTSYFRDIDLMRAKKDQETVLPLNRRERKEYIPLTSFTLIAYERNKLLRSAIFLGLTTSKICFLMAIDYGLFWVLDLIRYHGRFQTKVERPNAVGIYISGTGYIAELYRSIVRAFSIENFDVEMDTLPCLPDPLPPDYDRYTQIIVLIVFCWIMVIFEPYGLRIRQIVMNRYYPDRAKQRAVYLYNEIIRSRGSFLKFARRQLRRKFGMDSGDNVERVTLKERLLAVFPKLNMCFPQKLKMCLLCGAVQREGKTHFKCPNPTCIGLFCVECFADLLNVCTICKNPMEYGDLSDISEEKDSSDDEVPPSSTEERGKKLQWSDWKGDDPEAGKTNQDTKKLQDDVTIQIFNEPLRGGGDYDTENFFDDYEMNQPLLPCKSSMSLNRTVSLSIEESKETELTYIEMDNLSLSRTHRNRFMKSLDTQDTPSRNLLLGQARLTEFQDDNHWRKYNDEYTNIHRYVSTSVSTGSSQDDDVGNTFNRTKRNVRMDHNFRHDTDDTNSTNDTLSHDRSPERGRCSAIARYSRESTRCYTINERDRIQHDSSSNLLDDTKTILTSSVPLKTSSIDSGSDSISGDPLSLNSDSNLSTQLLENSDLSIDTDAQSSSERQRRQEVMRWYHDDR